MNTFLLDVNFKMPEKGVTVLFGPSGSGKTSVLNLIAGLNENEGDLLQAEFSLNGKVIDDSNNKIIK